MLGRKARKDGTVTDLTHYRISEFLPKLKNVPFIGKALAGFASAGHIMIVYQDVLRKGKAEWQRKNAKLAMPKSASRK